MGMSLCLAPYLQSTSYSHGVIQGLRADWLIDSGQYVDPATGRAAFSYAHPMFWAPFTLVGDGGASAAPRP